MKDELLDEKKRAEDILLGSLGFGEDAKIISLQRTSEGFAGEGQWSDGDLFNFESEDELSPLEHWALDILTG